jgi:hypothetical protein
MLQTQRAPQDQAPSSTQAKQALGQQSIPAKHPSKSSCTTSTKRMANKASHQAPNKSQQKSIPASLQAAHSTQAPNTSKPSKPPSVQAYPNPSARQTYSIPKPSQNLVFVCLFFCLFVCLIVCCVLFLCLFAC